MPGTSPLDARQNSFVYVFIIVVILIVLVLVILGMIAARRRNRKQTLEWINKQSKRKTKYIDVINLSHTAHLDSKESQFLWNMCKRYKPENIEYLNRNNEAISELFSKEYNRLSEIGKSELKIALLFSVRYKLEQAYNKRLVINSTRSLKTGQEVVYYDQNRVPVVLKIISMTNDYISFVVPSNVKDSKPAALSKLEVSFQTNNNSTYLARLRVVRYEIGKQNEDIMITNHSAALQMMQRRNSKRCDIDSDCEFSAIKPINNKHGIEMQIMDKKYKGVIADISATGCRLRCPYPIKKDQYINIYIYIPEVLKAETSGIIVDTKHSKDGKNYVLHIKFLDVPLELANKIYALSYGFIGKKEDELLEKKSKENTVLQNESTQEQLQELAPAAAAEAGTAANTEKSSEQESTSSQEENASETKEQTGVSSETAPSAEENISAPTDDAKENAPEPVNDTPVTDDSASVKEDQQTIPEETDSAEKKQN